MTYSTGGPGYPGAQPPGGYAPTTQLPKVDDGPSKLPLYLLGGVAILGLAAYLLSFGPVWKSGAASASLVSVLGVVGMLFAALFAVIGLLPKQGNYTPVVTATSVVGLLLIIWDLIKGGQAGWALIVIVVLSALQTLAVIALLLLDAGIIAPPAPRPKYEPYQPYGGGYYPQQSFSAPPSGPHPPGPQGFGPPSGYPPQFGYPGGHSSGGFPTQQLHTPQIHQPGPPTPPTGFPTYAQPPSAPPSGAPAQGAPAQGAPASAEQQPSPSGPPPS